MHARMQSEVQLQNSPSSNVGPTPPEVIITSTCLCRLTFSNGFHLILEAEVQCACMDTHVRVSMCAHVCVCVRAHTCVHVSLCTYTCVLCHCPNIYTRYEQQLAVSFSKLVDLNGSPNIQVLKTLHPFSDVDACGLACEQACTTKTKISVL